MKNLLFVLLFIVLLFTVVFNVSAQDLSYTPQPNDKFAWTYQGYEGRSKVFHVKVYRNGVPLPQVFKFVINYDSEDVMNMLEDSYAKYDYIPIIEKEYFMFFILSEDSTRVSIIRYQNYSKYSNIIEYIEQEAHIFIGN